MPRRLLTCVLVAAFLGGEVALAADAEPGPIGSPASALPDRSRVHGTAIPWHVPFAFEANLGQRGPEVALLASTGEATLELRAHEARLVLGADGGHVSLAWLGGRAVAPAGAGPLDGKVNYLLGNDPAAWLRDVPTFARAVYADVYPGIDLVFYGAGPAAFEYDFVVGPGASPGAILLQADAPGGMSVSGDGRLRFHTSRGVVEQHDPVAYQVVDGRRVPVEARLRWLDGHRFGFDLGRYDPARELIIDPVISYSTYLGGPLANGIAVDASGAAYVAGAGADAFVAKLHPSGGSLVYATYFGGSAADTAQRIAVDATGAAIVVGYTQSTDFPVASAAQASHGGGHDAFVAKLNPQGNGLVFATYLGGAGSDLGYGVAVDRAGNAYATGWTASTDFPTRDAYAPTGGADVDAWVAKLSPAGALVYSTYLGGPGDQRGHAIAVDGAGSAYVTGKIGGGANGHPLVNPILPPSPGGGVFITKFTPDGRGLAYSSVVGGSLADDGEAIAVDPAGNAYVAGFTSSPDFPVVNPIQSTLQGAAGLTDAIAFKVNAAGTALVYSTYLGGSADDFATGLGVTSSGQAYLIGRTGSTNFPQKDPLQARSAGWDGLVVRLGPTGALEFSTYLGGSGNDDLRDGAVDAGGSVYATGVSTSSNYPTRSAYLPTPPSPGSSNTVVTKICAHPSAPRALAATPGSIPGQVRLSWDPPLDDCGLPVVEHRVYRGTTSGALALVGTAGTAPSYTDNGLPLGVRYHYAVSAVNAAGEGARSDEASATTTRPPTAAIAPVPAAECTDRAATVSLDGRGSFDPDGDPLTYAWSAPGVSFIPSNAAQATAGFPLGATTVTLTVSDGALEASAQREVRVVDTLPPVTSASLSGTPGRAGWWVSPVDAGFAAADQCDAGPSTTLVAVDGGSAQPRTAVHLAREGLHALRYRSHDAEGNLEAERSLAVAVDTVPPVSAVQVAGLAGDDDWLRSPVDLAFSATDATSGVDRVDAVLDGAALAGVVSATVAREGEHALTFAATDRAGNVEPAKGVTFRNDYTPPTTTASVAGTPGDGGWWRSEVTIDLHATDAVSGVARVYHQVGEGDLVEGTRVGPLGDGIHAVRYFAQDRAGNVEPTRTLVAKVDATAPTLDLADPAAGAAYVQDLRVPLTFRLPATLIVGAKTVGGNASDATSGLARVELWIDGTLRGTGTSSPFSFRWASDREAPGFHRLELRAFDRAGNPAAQALGVTTVPSTAAGALATECRFLASPQICGALPPVPGVRPDDACALLLPAEGCAVVREALGLNPLPGA